MLGPRRRASTSGGIGLLDIGTSKVACLLLAGDDARDDAKDAVMHGAAAALGGRSLLGFGHQRSRGLKAATVVDLDQAEDAVRAAVSQAERMAGIELEAVYLAVGCGRLASLNFAASATVENGAVADADIARVTFAARSYAERDGRMLLHMDRFGFRLDGAGRIRDPRGMAGTRLEADIAAVTADDTPVRNLMHVVERGGLAVAGLIPAPLASALAVTTAEERRLGTVVVDMGAGATTIAMFAEGHLIAASAFPVGGAHLTFDIARSLDAPVAEAERIKTLYGTLLSAHSDEHDIVSYQLAGDVDADHHQATRAEIREIISPRVDGILGLVADRIARAPVPETLLGRIVLTGGASQLAGLGECAARRLGRPVRIGRPHPVRGLPDSVLTPAFAAAVGLAAALLDPDAGVRAGQGRDAAGAGYFGRVGQWIRESF